MAWTKTFLLRTGEVVYESQIYDLIFVSKTITMKCKGKVEYPRTRYCTFARGRHRKKEQGILWYPKDEWKLQMKFCKEQDLKQRKLLAADEGIKE